jgi:hypothetical protein
VTWQTVDEIDAVAFNLYRGPAPDGPWQRVNAVLIPAQLPGSTEGASYAYVYRGQHDVAWHRLEAVEVSGARFSFGPVLAQASEPNAVTVAEVRAGRVLDGWLAASLACMAVAGLIARTGRRRNRP